MARFTDQFNRYDPRTFRPSVLIPTWPAIVQQDAKELLIKFSDAELIERALAVEIAIESIADPATFPKNRSSWIWSRVKPGWIATGLFPSSDEIRNEFSDVNLFLFSLEQRRHPQHSLEMPYVDPWQSLAILSLWKLIDALDVLRGVNPDLIGGLIRPNRTDRKMYAAGIVMEAQAAISSAAQLKASAFHIEYMRRHLDGVESAKRSMKATHSVVAKHKKDDATRLKAFQLSDETPVKNLKVRAEYAYDRLNKDPEFKFSLDTVYDWITHRDLWETKIAARCDTTAPTE